MSTLLTERLSVVGQEHLRQCFSSALIFAAKGVPNTPEEEHCRRISQIEIFAEMPTANFLFSTLALKPENIKLWIECLATTVYALGTFEQQLQTQMQPLLANPKVRIAILWHTYAQIYANELLQLGCRTIRNHKHGFNLETVHYFINHPEQTHGEKLINNIPPLLENGYIFLNQCGDNQHTDWHRNTFMDSYFQALMSYQNILSMPKIRKAFA